MFFYFVHWLVCLSVFEKDAQFSLSMNFLDYSRVGRCSRNHS